MPPTPGMPRCRQKKSCLVAALLTLHFSADVIQGLMSRDSFFMRALALLIVSAMVSACAGRNASVDGLSPADIAAQQAIDDGELRPLAGDDFQD